MTRLRALLGAAVLLVVGLASAAPAAAVDPTPSATELPGIPIQVVVTGGSGPAVGSTSTGGAATGGSSHPSGSSDSVDESVPPADVAVAEPVASAETSSELDVSGLWTHYRASFDPAGGRLAVRFVVRNSTHRTIDATAHFWAAASLGGRRVGTSPTVAVSGLAPGESRTVTQEISGVGQWTLVTAHMKLSPVVPEGAPQVAPVARDRTVVAVPWAVLVLLLVVAAGIVSARLAGDRGVPRATPAQVVVA